MNDNLAVAVPPESGIAEQLPSQEEILQQIEARSREIDAVGEALGHKLSEATQWRLQYERRMLESDAQFRTGLVTIPEAKENNQARREQHRRAPDNITRSKTLAIAARRQDMLFSARNWSLRASPIATLHPEAEMLMAQAAQQGASPEQIESMRQEIATKRAARMEQIIDDRLKESNYDAHGRAVTLDSCKLGTGVLEGPFIKTVPRKTFNYQTGTFDVQYVPTQAVERCDPFCFFPQPCRHIREADYAFKLHIMSRTEVESLAKQPGFDPIQTTRLLKRAPNFDALKANCVLVGANGVQDPAALKGRYPVFKYRGPVPREMLELMAADKMSREVVAKMVEDDVPFVFGEVWMSMGITIRAVVDPMEKNCSLGYRIVNYERDPDSCFGYSVANVVSHDQDAAHMAWSAALANAMASAVPIPGIRKESLISEEGVYDLLKPGPWVLKGVDDIRKAISFSTVPSTIGPTLEIYDRAKRNAGEHLLLPEAAQGEASRATPQTASGLAMVMNAGNVVQRYAANEWDDEVTTPLLRDMVDYEMVWGKDPSAKGDFNVIPLASTHLLVKDVRLQQSIALMTMCMSNPELNARVRTDRVAAAIVRDMEMPADQYLRSDEEVAALAQEQQPQPSDAQIKAEADLARSQMEMETRMEEAAARIQQEVIRGEAAMQVAEINMRAMALKVAADEKITLDKVMVDMRIVEIEAENRTVRENAKLAATERLKALQEATKRIQIGAQTNLKATEIADRRASQALQVQVESPPRFQ